MPTAWLYPCSFAESDEEERQRDRPRAREHASERARERGRENARARARERERERLHPSYAYLLLAYTGLSADIIIENEAQGIKSVVLEKAGKGLGMLGPGDFFGELAALLPPSLAPYRRRYRTAFATATTHLGMLTHDDLMDLCKQRSDIAEVLVPYINAITETLPPRPITRTLSGYISSDGPRSPSPSPRDTQRPGAQ